MVLWNAALSCIAWVYDLAVERGRSGGVWKVFGVGIWKVCGVDYMKYDEVCTGMIKLCTGKGRYVRGEGDCEMTNKWRK